MFAPLPVLNVGNTDNTACFSANGNGDITVMTDIAQAIKAINPNAQFSVNAEDYEQITWLNGTTPIAVDTIKAKQAELKTAYDNNAYARKREMEYPSVQDFMEAYTEKEIGGDSTKWDAYKTAYNKVKTDNPKG